MLEFGYITLIILMTIILVYAYNYGLKRLKLDSVIVKKRTAYLVIGLLLWFAYVYLITKSGILNTFEPPPPRFPIFLIAPAFLFTGIILYKNKSSKMFGVIPKSWAIYAQTFRIVVKSLFVATVAAGLLHKEATIEGYNFDMVFAFTSPIIGYLVFNTKKLSKSVALYWNYLGLLVLSSVIFVFITTIYFPQIWGSDVPLAPIEMTGFPFTFVASFLMPVAVFVHIFSIIQLNKHD